MSSLRGLETWEVCADVGRGPHMVLHLGPPAGLHMDRETCEGCAEMGGEPHVDSADGAFSAAPYGAAKRLTGVPQLTGGPREDLVMVVPKRVGNRMWVKLPMGPRNL